MANVRDDETAPAGRGATTEPAGTSPDLLRLRGVDVTLGGTDVLSGLSLSVGAGEFVSVIGPSGCGKSTLLRVAAGLTAPTSGSVERATDNIGFVFQDPTLMPWRTVARNVRLLGELAGTERKRLRAEAAQAIETVGLAEFADRLPRELSGGMRMRASLARSLVLRPDLFLFDEPFGALDEITREQLNLVLMGLFRARSFGGLFVTHSVEEAVFLSTRVVVLSPRPGRLLADIPVTFGFPRALDLRYTPAFAALAGRVAGLLEGAL
ncbi:ABC transporter ATP-binding protein [Propionicicella superfundia]|uniref:ABC transporter ATP-binding protein n=1 Tax=Propionicicella superfundia TaxID=348582 RepID=UPI0004171501|nr:ABC transporter ATP-binding protein [Propionicicella superfundia]